MVLVAISFIMKGTPLKNKLYRLDGRQHRQERRDHAARLA